ncbi:M28 family peptidase [Limnoglobus roseus]|uniref:PDZ domain-containing protein n=1 Tax=Limnoglobus roseus TaxID=2598579 RepID=A0A5C1A800_9BACT|nr:M28 family peptidase [Limnoglobus roseus]QEL13298.1 PDZ domain-containing protein [Limnoglobus roseus]
MKRLLACLSLMGAASVCPAVTPEESLARMKKDIGYLAGPECNGRSIGGDGINKAADKIVEVFKGARIQPGNKDSYFQPFTVTGRAQLGTPNKVTLTEKGKDGVEWKFNDEYAILGTSASGKGGGELVFLGYGLSVNTDKLKYDDYAGQDVKGKVVVVLRKTPKAEQKDTPFVGDLANSAALVAKVELAEKNGAAGIVFVNDRTGAKPDDPLMDLRRSGGTPAKIPVLQVKRVVLEKFLAAQDKKLADVETAIDKEMKPVSVPLKGYSIATELTINRDPIACKNVVGVLPGSGPLADETIVIGAHYDHLGTSSQGSLAGRAGEGQVHFGADDNASGTTSLLELARRFGEMQNRFGRRIVFIAFSGEERGLLGSMHYAKEPLVPLDKTVFMLNLDMVGRAATIEEGGKKKFRVVASGVGTSDGFDKLVDTVNKRFDFKILKTPGGTGPSDHQSFYQKNVPVLFIHTGTHKDYHRPTDTPDKIEMVGMEKIVEFCEIIAAHLATVPERPNYLTTTGRWSDPTDTSARNMAKMPRLGVMPGNYEEEGKGVLVEDVLKEGAAEAAGVKAGDFIIDIAGKPVKNIDDYMAALAAQKAGVEIEITVMRMKEKKALKITPKPGT